MKRIWGNSQILRLYKCFKYWFTGDYGDWLDLGLVSSGHLWSGMLLLCAKNDLQVILAMHTGQRGSINLSLISECRLYEGNNCWIRAKMHSCCGSALGLHATSPLVQSWEQLENTSHKQAYVATFQLDFLSLLEIISCCVPVCWLVEVGHSKKKNQDKPSSWSACPFIFILTWWKRSFFINRTESRNILSQSDDEKHFLIFVPLRQTAVIP